MADEPSTTAADEAPGQDEDRGQSEGRTFTQEQFERELGARLNRTKAQFKDYPELKAKAEKLDELENARKSEAEKLLAAVDKYKTEAQSSLEREQAALNKANTTLKRAAVIAEAARQKAIDPDAVYALLNKDSLTIGDGDQVEGVSDAVATLLQERSYLAGGRPQGGFDGGARETAPAETSTAELNREIRRQAGF